MKEHQELTKLEPEDIIFSGFEPEFLRPFPQFLGIQEEEIKFLEPHPL